VEGMIQEKYEVGLINPIKVGGMTYLIEVKGMITTIWVKWYPITTIRVENL
jgi:hypothetical protein